MITGLKSQETDNFVSTDRENIFKGVASALASLIIAVSVLTLYSKPYFSPLNSPEQISPPISIQLKT